MKRVWQFFSRQGIACLGVGLFAVCALIVFFPALPKFMGLASPDAPPYFIFAYSTSVIEGC